MRVSSQTRPRSGARAGASFLGDSLLEWVGLPVLHGPICRQLLFTSATFGEALQPAAYGRIIIVQSNLCLPENGWNSWLPADLNNLVFLVSPFTVPWRHSFTNKRFVRHHFLRMWFPGEPIGSPRLVLPPQPWTQHGLLSEQSIAVHGNRLGKGPARCPLDFPSLPN